MERPGQGDPLEVGVKQRGEGGWEGAESGVDFRGAGAGLGEGPGSSRVLSSGAHNPGAGGERGGRGHRDGPEGKMTVGPGRGVGKGPRNNSRTDRRMARWMEGCSSAERKQTLDRALEMDVGG